VAVSMKRGGAASATPAVVDGPAGARHSFPPRQTAAAKNNHPGAWNLQQSPFGRKKVLLTCCYRSVRNNVNYRSDTSSFTVQAPIWTVPQGPVYPAGHFFCPPRRRASGRAATQRFAVLTVADDGRDRVVRMARRRSGTPRPPRPSDKSSSLACRRGYRHGFCLHTGRYRLRPCHVRPHA